MKRKIRLYLAGPMTGYEHYNFPRFWDVADRLHAIGYDVVNPAEKESTPDRLPDMDKLPVAIGGNNPDVQAADLRKADFVALLDCDGIVLLPGWESSWGAKLEAAMGQAIGLQLFEFYDTGGMWGIERLPIEVVFRVTETWKRHGHQDLGNLNLTELKRG